MKFLEFLFFWALTLVCSIPALLPGSPFPLVVQQAWVSLLFAVLVAVEIYTCLPVAVANVRFCLMRRTVLRIYWARFWCVASVAGFVWLMWWVWR